ncbi:unnamed protein product [Phyllotreta striolata]|uniref:Double-strand break repair protein n=1 Tax=Phyllotreta striolata TaxID=444603 RepID=A0A9N9TLK9_PHYSR|nr:unnamed protein product [Phyllotreta striolata]
MSHTRASSLISQEESEPSEADTFRILLATDIHLGYAEDHPVRGNDTFETFEEILRIAVEEDVDFILLGGDLFHFAQPTPNCIHKCLELLKKYCLGDKPVSVEFLSDPNLNFTRSENSTVNYEDPNLNVSMPIFSIHGNHDDPTGKSKTSSLDIISATGLVNYFGNYNNYDSIEISPILLRKGATKLALYGLSHIRDERLGRLFLEGKVKILTPDDKDDWFHLLAWHQNRVARSTKNFIPDDSLPDFLDLVLWGHEHDCRIEPERKVNGVYVTQPGSSVATSLTPGEAIPKHVGVLKVAGREFKIEPIPLKTVRPFIIKELALHDPPDDIGDVTPMEYSKDLIHTKIREMIEEAKSMGQTAEVSEKPLIRLSVKYNKESLTFNSIRFGHSYADQVANPDSMVKFQSIRDAQRRKGNASIAAEGEAEDDELILADCIEEFIAERLENKLKFFSKNSLIQAVMKSIGSSDKNAIIDIGDSYRKKLMEALVRDKPDSSRVDQYVREFKDKVENDDDFAKVLLGSSTTMESPENQTSVVTIDGDDCDDQVPQTSTRGKRGRGSPRVQAPTRGRGRGRGRGKKAAAN